MEVEEAGSTDAESPTILNTEETEVLPADSQSPKEEIDESEDSPVKPDESLPSTGDSFAKTELSPTKFVESPMKLGDSLAKSSVSPMDVDGTSVNIRTLQSQIEAAKKISVQAPSPVIMSPPAFSEELIVAQEELLDECVEEVCFPFGVNFHKLLSILQYNLNTAVF